ncbi:MAG: hypothetical protein IH624_18500, partial [Phycisphaerae bacterium]|nr:hypothetical protein [Phycisphaerae bacterium]
MVQPEGPKPKGQKSKKLMLVRYGRMGFLGWFEHNESDLSKVNARVVIKTRRGLEMGTLVGQYSYRGGQFKMNPGQVEQYFNGPGKDFPLAEGGTFVRFATPEDIMEEKHLEASAKEEGKCCDRFIREMNLPMKVVDSEHLFGGERIVIYFTSNGRVDFRDLVRKIAREYQTRIELRQIGSRDEAKLVSDFESCGQECCCRRFLKILEPVNMRMAKLQKATLDPSKISGHCGRLKCCLRYEDDTYRDLKTRLPRKNALVKTAHGEGRVVGVQILTQLVILQDARGDREAYHLDEIESIDGKRVERAAKKEEVYAEPEEDFFCDNDHVCACGNSASPFRREGGPQVDAQPQAAGDDRPDDDTPEDDGPPDSSARDNAPRDNAPRDNAPRD